MDWFYIYLRAKILLYALPAFNSLVEEKEIAMKTFFSSQSL